MNVSSIHKLSQWCILSTHHSKYILRDVLIYHELSKCYAPDELVYLTILYALRHQINITDCLTSGATTFVNWSQLEYPYQNHIGPKNYSVISVKEMDYLLKQPCLFGRKFNSECKVVNSESPMLDDVPLSGNQEIYQLSQYLTHRIC